MEAVSRTEKDVFVLASHRRPTGTTLFGVKALGHASVQCNLTKLSNAALYTDRGANDDEIVRNCRDFRTQRFMKALYRSKHKRPRAEGARYDDVYGPWHGFCVDARRCPTGWWQVRGESVAPSDRTCTACLRAVSLDIEVLPCSNGDFPDAALPECEVISVSAVVVEDVLRADPQAAHSTHVFVAAPCATPLPKLDTDYDPAQCVVHAHEGETNMIKALARWLKDTNPHFIVGWNVHFDLTYLCRRSSWFSKVVPAASHASATVDARNECHVPGRVVVDMCYVFRVLLRYKARSFKLGDVAAAELQGVTKCPMRYSDLRPYWAEGPESRAKIATYNCKDSYLVVVLMLRRRALWTVLALAQTCYLEPDTLLRRGQSARVMSMVRVACRHNVPERLVICTHKDATQDSKNRAAKRSYKGALVLQAQRALSNDPVITLDFRSLYPSIIMAFNMCPSTKRRRAEAVDVARALNMPIAAAARVLAFAGDVASDAIPAHPLMWWKICEFYFAKQTHRRGVLPTILRNMLERRMNIKQEMAQEKDALRKIILDANQRAVKEAMNSVYGVLALEELPIADFDVARCITARGRELLQATAKHAPQRCRFPASVVYGDTDSVMLRLRGATPAQASAEGMRLAQELNDSVFPHDIVLEWEKTYAAYLQYKQKSYAGLLCRPGGGTSFTASGLELVRTDCAPVVTRTQRTCVELALRGSVREACVALGDTLENILENKNLNTNDFVRCATLSKEASAYANAPPHAAVAQRHGGLAKGDVVPYIVQQGDKFAALADLAVHPDDWDSARHAIHRLHYANAVRSAVMPYLETAAIGSAPIAAFLKQQARRGERSTWLPQNAPLVRMWNLTPSLKRAAWRQDPENAARGKRQQLLKVIRT